MSRKRHRMALSTPLERCISPASDIQTFSRQECQISKEKTPKKNSVSTFMVEAVKDL